MAVAKKRNIIGPDYIKKPIEFIMDSPYKGTAFKVELEANLNRANGSVPCISCRGRGYRFCRDCSNGYVDGTRKLTCKTCRGWFRIPCKFCKELGHKKTKVMNDFQCYDFILKNVSARARKALIYSLFYYDGSVGSEFTFTLPLPKAVYAVEFVKAFKLLSEHIGGGLDTDGAGMHLAILNDPDGNYPSGNETYPAYVNNFAKAMTHFLPTLYFLGSASFRSRGLGFRGPQISTGKGSAINCQAGGSGAFEYRFFETCYERPEAVLDDLCVIAKTLKFYSDKPAKLPFFGKIGDLGIRDGLGVHRFYFTEKHLKALDEGLEYLKPDHKTVAQLKRERNFTVTYERLKKRDDKFDLKTEQEWAGYKLRSSRQKELELKKLTNAYKRMVQVNGKAQTTLRYGTQRQYVKNSQAKTETLKTYKDKKKKQFLTRKIVRTIKV